MNELHCKRELSSSAPAALCKAGIGSVTINSFFSKSTKEASYQMQNLLGELHVGLGIFLLLSSSWLHFDEVCEGNCQVKEVETVGFKKTFNQPRNYCLYGSHSDANQYHHLLTASFIVLIFLFCVL
jgi:hypothetical protein